MTKTTKSYTEMLKDELLVVARSLGLTSLSRLRKDEILDLVRRAKASKARKAKKAKAAKPAKAAKQATTKSRTSAAAAKVTKARTTKAAKAKPAKAMAAKAKPAKAAKAAKPAKVAKAKPAKAKPTKAAKPATTRNSTTAAAAAKVTKARTAKTAKTAKAKTAKPATTRTRIRPSKAAAEKTARAAAAKLTDEGASTAAEPSTDRASGSHLRPSPLGPVSHQSSAVASKYEAGRTGGPADLQQIDGGLPELPESYGDNRIVLMPRDISWLFTYWDLTDEYKDAARSAGGNVLALRLYDVTGLDFNGTNSHGMYEQECTEWARSWYIPTPTPDRDYVVEIGYRGADQWFPLARSNKVSVPSDQPSTWIKDDFISINFDEDLQQVHGRFKTPERPSSHGVATPAPQGFAAPEQTILDDGELRITVGGTLLPPSGGPAWPPFSATAQEGPSYNLPSSQSFVPGSLGYPSSYEFMTGSISHLPSSSNLVGGGVLSLPSSPDFLGVIPLDRLMGPKPGAPLEPGAESDQPGAAERRGEAPLMVTTMEMVISGRSVPGTSLRIAGRPIPLGPDGCFSLRITVPEGTRELPIEARANATGEVQLVTLHLGRKSE